MDSRGPGPLVRIVSPVLVPDNADAAASQKGPVVPHPQNYGGQPHWSFPPVNLIQQQGQTTAQITSQQQWQQQQYSMGGQNQRLSQNQNEVYMPSQQPNCNPHLINFSRPAVPQPQNYGGNPYLGIPNVNFLPQQRQTTAQQASQQQRQQQQYLMNGQNGLSAPNQYEVYTPFQQQSFNQRMTITSRPALVSNRNYGVQDLLGVHSGNKIQQLEEITAQPISHHQQHHQQQLQCQQQFMNEQMAPQENKAYMSYRQPHSNQEWRTPLRQPVFNPQNNGAQAPWGLHPFIQQEGHTTLQPALQQQQPHQQQRQHQHHQQHSMKGLNEQFTPHRYTAYRNDASMPFERPNSDQFMTTSSRYMRTSSAAPMKSTSSSPLHPMGNMSAFPAGPIGNMYNSSDVPIGRIYTLPAVPMENMSAIPAVPMGNMSASPAPVIGNMSTFPLHPIGNMSASPPVPIENKSTNPAVPKGNMSTSLAAPMESMSTSPTVPMEKMPASFADPMGNMSTFPTSSMKNMALYHVEQMGNMSDSIGNDHSTLHDLNKSQHLDPTDDSFSQFPIMAEKRSYDESIKENVNITIAKRPKTDEDTDPLCTSVTNQDLYGDESGCLDSENSKDPLSDLTKDQRVVLYTLFLCTDNLDYNILDDDVAMGDIDVWKIVKELENKGLVTSFSDYKKHIPYYTRSMIMKSYSENCLLSEIDKDFFLQVVSDKSIETYVNVYFRHGDGSRESEDLCPITLMRLIVEGHGHRLPSSVKDEVPACLIDDEKEVEIFVKFWCKARDTNPITLSDQIPDEKVKNFYSAFTILSEIKNEFMEMHLSKKKWSILISILLSERYSGCENIRWEENRKNIQQTFKALQVVEEEGAEEDLVLIKELELCDELITLDRENNKVYFVSEEIRHQVMGFFVLNCLQSKDDYKNYLNLSSMDSLFEYVRPLGYRRQSTERCMYLPKGTEEVFVRRFGIDAICNATPGFEELSNAILSELKIPPVVLKMSQGTKIKFCNFVKGFDEEHEHQQLNRNSLFGSFLIDLNTSEKKGFFTSQPSSPKMSILCTILFSNDYTLCLDKQLKDNIKETRQRFSLFQRNEKVEDDLPIEELVENDKVLIRNNALNNVKFATDEVRHQVMSFFVRTSLITDEDYINYINLSSVDSLLEYVRVWEYKNVEEERCLHLPKRIKNIYIEKLDVHILCHVNMEMLLQYSRNMADKLHIPMEVLEWDYEARRRYVDCLKKGTQMVHRARAMIVGCAGAGKTTLLERLQNHTIDKLKEIESTVGLDVHENIFEIENNSLKALSGEQNNEKKCLLSVVDFAGQCAYYACHQVYLSRRAFYLLVIDRSKPFQDQVDRKLCEQEGTMFSDWTYGQYIIFWLKSIHTYCDDDTPVITIGKHCDKIQNVGKSIYDDLFELLKDEPELMMHIDSSKCFHIGFPLIDNGPIDKLTDIEECIASIALEDRWKETIPKDWALCETAFRENKQRGKKMISLSNFKKQVSSKMSKNDKETFDMLRFYNEIGSILHFNEEDLKDKTIVDVQWFVDCFKNIITDTNHVKNIAKNYAQWQDYNRSGYLSEKLLHEIWKKTKLDLRKCKPTLKYMQRLGLVAVGKEFHYIPCMNKLDFGNDLKRYISSLSQNSSVLIFKFEFLPHFFYFRLVVACMVDAHWTVVEDVEQKYVFKSAVCFTFENHLIVLAVTMTTIQIQIFRQGDVLSFEVTKKIRDTIIENLKRLTKNFHKKAIYLKGYQCSRQSVLEELTSDFLLEDEILGKGQITCPRHGGKNHHFVSERELLLYWTDEKQEDFSEAKVIQGMQEHRKDDFSASKFRKPNDNSLHSIELKTFFSRDWQDSVGHLLCGDLAGTAFRVGDQYLLTAFHIIESTLDACLRMIIENAQCDPSRGNNCLYLLQELKVEVTGSGVEKMIENGIKQWITKCKDNLWISSLLEVLKVTGFSFAREKILKNISENHMQVVFGRMKEHEEGIKYPVKFDIPFYSKTEDIAILEVVPTNLHRLPSAFSLEISIITPESIHIVGYPASHGRKQIFDPKCPLISEMEARSTLEQWKILFPGENFGNFSRACASAFYGKEKVLFHCSESTAHGASGSPGLILSDTDKPKVYLMLQEGFPSFVYGNNCQVDIKTVPKEYLIESGISMSRVYSLLSTTPYLVNLRNAIFHI